MPTGSPPCPSRETLLALVLTELPPERAAELAAHVERCERCLDHVSSIASERANVRRGGRERRLVPGTDAGKKAKRAGKPWFFITLAVAVGLGGFLALRAQREPDVIELPAPGVAPPTVRAFARVSGELRELGEGTARLAAGDRIRLAIDGARSQHLLVVVVEEGGVVRALWPPRAGAGGAAVVSRRFEPGDRGFLPGDVALTSPAQALRLFALFSGGPIRVADVARAAREELAKSAGLAALRRIPVPSTHAFTLYIERAEKTR